MPKNTKLGLITLTGGGDTEIYLVPECVIDWIYSPRPKFGRNGWGLDTVPVAIQKLFEAAPDVELPITLTCGSPENDRALYCGHIATHSAFSVKEMLALCRKHSIKVGKTYEGCIY